ncbi:glycosyltransferase family 2 protein [Eoetvoesiella caeni]|uniref:Glycosyl transferase family 2 n=1 Tax=Eoetvoesiella caeni TaxID=645616 RepID=A0A366HDN8_9BURK|nr:glycosyltransferase family 2 protein [Eoetvoesiella caeni]MCI2809286.1 glycosyltransferase [Eoetvoesiella caeni]NYT54426.1 glycosyltransferase [Eoetvoesiella caeni]RBP39386.1 glycosyl transferase family 2 [Eoetvoesiella caeni]
MSAQHISSRYLFTVLTPTYNRAHTLPRVYASLREQTFQDFEWIVVDDGSTDDTRQVVQAWQQEAHFPIHYFWQANQHKKAAFNRGVQESHGELIVALDSDDSLDMNALDAMARTWHDIPEPSRAGYVAVTGLCARPNGSIVGDMFPQDEIDATAVDMSFKYHVGGEKFGCMVTEVLRRFPFPEDIPGFVPESLVWRAMARAGYLTRFVNQVFRVYHDTGDSLSAQGRSNGAQHAEGLWLLAQDTVVECLPWFRYRPAEFFKAAARYTRFGMHLKREGKTLPGGRSLKGWGARALVALMWPAGALMYWRDRRRA